MVLSIVSTTEFLVILELLSRIKERKIKKRLLEELEEVGLVDKKLSEIISLS